MNAGKMEVICSECLMNRLKRVVCVEKVCPECRSDFSEVTEFVVACVVPRPDRNSAPVAA